MEYTVRLDVHCFIWPGNYINLLRHG